MSEDFMHYLWQFKLYSPGLYKTTEGDALEIIHPGLLNSDSGPDFFNAKIRIDSTLWAGNVELHLKSSDWYQHSHHTDHSYDNVVLHVVFENDKTAQTSSASHIPTWIMPVDESMLHRYRKLYQSKLWIPCAQDIHRISPFKLANWLERMMVEKLESKIEWIHQLLKESKNNWDELFYISLCRSFGFGVNGDAFEHLAKSIPWDIVQKNRDDLLKLEALFLGQAGFLSLDSELDNYTSILVREYKHLVAKYRLKTMDQHLWKFMRLRPSNFPSVRLTQLAALFHKENLSLSKVIKAASTKKLMDMLKIQPSEYWQNHYRPNVASTTKSKSLGKHSKQLLIINTFVPILFAYGKASDNDSLQHKALQWMVELPAETNSILKNWETLQIKAKNASESQALVHLKQNYCNLRKCLHCRIGHLVLTKDE